MDGRDDMEEEKLKCDLNIIKWRKNKLNDSFFVDATASMIIKEEKRTRYYLLR